MASSTMAVRISGVIFRPGSGISLTHILTKWTPWPARARTISRASSVRGGLPGARVEAARVREAAAGGEHARRVGAAGVGLEHQRRLLGAVGADAARGGDAEVELRPQHLQGRVGVAPVVVVHVHEPGDDGLAGGVDDLRARGNPGTLARPGGDDAVVADHDHRIRDRIAARAVDELGADDGQATGLGGRRAAGTGGQCGDNDENGKPRQHCSHVGGHRSTPSARPTARRLGVLGGAISARRPPIRRAGRRAGSRSRTGVARPAGRRAGAGRISKYSRRRARTGKKFRP